jgi:hypothetical protein
MNKQQTIETLQKQLPSFYSLEQVINIINSIEDNNNTLSYDLIQMIIKKISRSLHDSSELIDYGSAEFELEYNNTITLASIDVDIDKILEIVEEELDRYVTESNSDVAESNSDVAELERG